MNSYGSVSLVSQAIYKLLRYMNFFPQPTDPDIADANVRLQLEEEQLQEDQLQEEQEKPAQEQVTPANQLDEVAQTVNIPQ
jgi:hypothetical protein